jgi:hypothetical protein
MKKLYIVLGFCIGMILVEVIVHIKWIIPALKFGLDPGIAGLTLIARMLIYIFLSIWVIKIIDKNEKTI